MGATTARNSRPRRRRGRAPIALVALCALAAGVQALAPASAGAVAAQPGPCVPLPEAPWIGFNGADYCSIGGGEIISIEETIACPTLSRCLANGPQHAGPGGGGAGSDGAREPGARGTSSVRSLLSRLRSLAPLWECPALEKSLKKLRYKEPLAWRKRHSADLGGNPFRDEAEETADRKMQRRLREVLALLGKWDAFDCKNVLPDVRL